MRPSVEVTRNRVDARLPALGVRLGNVGATEVTLGVVDYSGRDEPYAIALVPVVERAGRLALYRANNPSDDSPPQPGDIGPVIRLWHKPVAPAPGARGIGADLIDLPPGQAKVRMPRECWAGDALGTIVVTIYLLAEPRHPPPPKELRINIAKTIDLLLKTSRREELELLLVPTVAIETPARPDRLRFALASCQYARGMIDGTPAALRTGSGDAAVDAPLPGPSDASYARLGRVIDGDNDHPRLQFAVLAGDQVYVDATAGLFDPTASRGRYRKPYEQLYGSRVVQDVQRRLPMYMVLDDHEIEDNWEDGDDRVLGPRMVRARQFYGEYERSTDTLPDIVPLWCEKPIDGFDFFFADTRTERRTRDAGNVETAEILGAAQAEALAAWLGRGNDDGRPRFLVSSAILLPRLLATSLRRSAALASDAWDGYPESLDAVLESIAARGQSNIVCLSGDAHLSCVAIAKASRGRQTVRLHSIHCSGLYTPYPFANARADDFAGDDTFYARSGQWQVASTFHEGQGFAVIDVRANGQRWDVAVDFNLDRDSGEPFTFSLKRTVPLTTPAGRSARPASRRARTAPRPSADCALMSLMRVGPDGCVLSSSTGARWLASAIFCHSVTPARGS